MRLNPFDLAIYRFNTTMELWNTQRVGARIYTVESMLIRDFQMEVLCSRGSFYINQVCERFDLPVPLVFFHHEEKGLTLTWKNIFRRISITTEYELKGYTVAHQETSKRPSVVGLRGCDYSNYAVPDDGFGEVMNIPGMVAFRLRQLSEEIAT